MNAPALSVVMSVFNGQAFLSEAVESILNQTFGDFEFIIIDDGSTDKTAEMLSAYASRDARIRLIRHENKGRTASLNDGISLARADYIARMDADDIEFPKRLEAQVNFMDRNPEVGVLGGAVEVIKAAGQVLDFFQPPVEDSDIKSAMLHGNPMWHPTVVLRKEVLLAVGGYRTIFDESEDYDLFLRMGERSRLANLGNAVLKYRIHANQASVKNMRHQAVCVVAARAAASLRRRGIPDPLSDAQEVTPQLLAYLGVTGEEIQQMLSRTYTYWAHVVKKVDNDLALWVIEELLQLSDSGFVERSVLADAWLAAADIHYRQGRPAKALLCGGRALLLRPIVAGRPVKRALNHLVAAMKG